MSSLVVICHSSYYRFVLLPHYELVPPRTSIACIVFKASVKRRLGGKALQWIEAFGRLSFLSKASRGDGTA
jgi:hypothetical protein